MTLMKLFVHRDHQRREVGQYLFKYVHPRKCDQMARFLLFQYSAIYNENLPISGSKNLPNIQSTLKRVLKRIECTSLVERDECLYRPNWKGKH